MAGRPPIPEPTADDDEDVSWALSTAAALFARGEAAESLKWLRRAAETASDANRDMRAVHLFKAAADMANEVERSKSQLPPPPPSQAPPSRASSLPPMHGETPPPSRRPPPPAPPRKSSAPMSGGSAVPAPPPPPPPPPTPVARLSAPSPPGRAPIDAARKAPVIVAPAISVASDGARTRRPGEPPQRQEPNERPRGFESDRATLAGVGNELAKATRPDASPPVGPTPRRGRTSTRTKGLTSLHAQATRGGRDRTPAPSPAPRESTESIKSNATKNRPEPEPSAVRAKREDEITAIRDYGLRPSTPNASASSPRGSSEVSAAPDIAAFASSFDDEQTHVLAGEESFVDLGSTRDDKNSPAKDLARGVSARTVIVDEKTVGAPDAAPTRDREATPPVAPSSRETSSSLASASVTAFRVAIVADGASVQLLPLRGAEAPGAGVPTALIVPTDAASSEAIRLLLATASGSSPRGSSRGEPK